MKNNTKHRQTISKDIKTERENEFKKLCEIFKMPLICKAPAVYHLDLDNQTKLLIYPTTLKWHISVRGGFLQKDVKHCCSPKELVNQINTCYLQWIQNEKTI